MMAGLVPSTFGGHSVDSVALTASAGRYEENGKCNVANREIGGPREWQERCAVNFE
jgi:hypothetical protein